MLAPLQGGRVRGENASFLSNRPGAPRRDGSRDLGEETRSASSEVTVIAFENSTPLFPRSPRARSAAGLHWKLYGLLPPRAPFPCCPPPRRASPPRIARPRRGEAIRVFDHPMIDFGVPGI